MEGDTVLEKGTEVSAKFKGAYCEAVIERVEPALELRVNFLVKGKGSHLVSDKDVKGEIKLQAQVEAKHPSDGAYYPATIVKITDNSIYYVEFDDGDTERLKRAGIRLKGSKHFSNTATIDALPLTDPEKFALAPVVDAPKPEPVTPKPTHGTSKKKTSTAPPKSSKGGSKSNHEEENEGGQWAPKRPAFFVEALGATFWRPAVMVPDEEVDETMPAKSDPSDRIVRYLDDLSFCCVRERSLRPFGRDAPLYKHFVRESRKAFLDDKGVQAALAYIDHMHTPDGFMWAQFAKKAHAERARAQARAYRESQAPRSAPQPAKSNRSGPASFKAKTTPRLNGTSISGQQSSRTELQSPARTKQDAPSTPVKPPAKPPSTPIPSLTSSQAQQTQKQKKRKHDHVSSSEGESESDEESVGGNGDFPERKSTKRAKSEQRKERGEGPAPVWRGEECGGGGEKEQGEGVCVSKKQKVEQGTKKSAGEDTASEDSRRSRVGRAGRTDSMSSSDVGSPFPDSELLHEGWMYKLGDRVWAMSYLDGKIYEAKVVKRQLMSTGREKRGGKSGPSALSNYRHMPVPHYYCRYKGWGERYAEWIEESQVFCTDPAAGITEKTRKRAGGHVDAVSAFEKPPKRQRSTSQSISLSDVPSDVDLKEMFEDEKDGEEGEVVVEEKKDGEDDMEVDGDVKEDDSKKDREERERRRERKREKKKRKKSGKKSRSGKRKEKPKVEESEGVSETDRKEDLDGDEREDEGVVKIGRETVDTEIAGMGEPVSREIGGDSIGEEPLTVKEEVVGDVMEVGGDRMEDEVERKEGDRIEEGERIEGKDENAALEDIGRLDNEIMEEDRKEDNKKERKDRSEGKEKKSKRSHSKSRDKKGKHKKSRSRSKERERMEGGRMEVEVEVEEEEERGMKDKPEDSSSTDAIAACMILDESHTTEHHEPATPTTTNQSSVPVSHGNQSSACVSMDTDDVDVSGTPLPTPTSTCKSMDLGVETEKIREDSEGVQNDDGLQPNNDAAVSHMERLQDPPTETQGITMAESGLASLSCLKAGEHTEGAGLAADAALGVSTGTMDDVTTDQSDVVPAPPKEVPQPMETCHQFDDPDNKLDGSVIPAAATTVSGVKEQDGVGVGVKHEYGAACSGSAPPPPPQTSEECEVVVVDVVETAPSPLEPTRLRTRKQSASSAGMGPGEEEQEEDLSRLTTTRGRTGGSLRRVRTISEDIAECEEAGRLAALAALGGEANMAPPSLRRPVRNSTAKPPRNSKPKGDDGEASVGEHSAQGGSDGGFVRPVRNSALGKNGKSSGGGKVVDVGGDGVSVSQQSSGHGKRKGGSSKKGKSGSRRDEKRERGTQSKSCTIYTSRTHKQSLESGVTLTKEEFKVSHKYDKNGVTIADEHIHEVKHTVEDRVTNQRTTNRVLSCTNEKPIPIDELEMRMEELRRQYMEHRMELARLDRLKHSKKRHSHHHHSNHNHSLAHQHTAWPRTPVLGAHSSPRIGQSDASKAHSSPRIGRLDASKAHSSPGAFASSAVGRGRSPVCEIKHDPITIAPQSAECKPVVPTDFAPDSGPCESVGCNHGAATSPQSSVGTTNPPVRPLEHGVPPTAAAPSVQSEPAIASAPLTDSAMQMDPPSFSTQRPFEYLAHERPHAHAHGNMEHAFAIPDHMQTVGFHHPMESMPHPMYGGIMVGATEVLSPLQAICAAIDLIGSMDAAMAQSGGGDSAVGGGDNGCVTANQPDCITSGGAGVMNGPYVVDGPGERFGSSTQIDTSPEMSAEMMPTTADKAVPTEILPTGEFNPVSSNDPLGGQANGPVQPDLNVVPDPAHSAHKIELKVLPLHPPFNDLPLAHSSPNVWGHSFPPGRTYTNGEGNVFSGDNTFLSPVSPSLTPGLANGPCEVPPIAKVSGTSNQETKASCGLLERFGNAVLGAVHSSEHSMHTADSQAWNQPDSGVVEGLNLPHETVKVVMINDGVGVGVGGMGVVEGENVGVGVLVITE